MALYRTPRHKLKCTSFVRRKSQLTLNIGNTSQPFAEAVSAAKRAETKRKEK